MESIASFFVAGVPSSYSTRGEVVWKEAIARQILPPTSPEFARGVTLDFVVSPTSRHKGWDVDNLCEPVFSTLVNRIGWFRRSRSNIKWWNATRVQGGATGCTMSIFEENAPPADIPTYAAQGVYSGTFPLSARDPMMNEWCIKTLAASRTQSVEQTFGCMVEYGSSTINIGDIASGPTKKIVDCLYPVWGGVSGAPFDHLIVDLTVAKGVSDVMAGSVRITVWQCA